MSRLTENFERWLEAHLPPGISAQQEHSFLKNGLIAAVMWAGLVYLGSYCAARSKLYDMVGNQLVLDPTAQMADFGKVFRFTPLGYFVLAVWLVVKGFGFLAYHRQGSMSIYLMRRLPDPREYARRCWTVPLMGVAGCLVLTAVTTALCYLIYIQFTPEACLVPGQWTRFWSALIGR